MVFASPGVPGARPSNSSDASVRVMLDSRSMLIGLWPAGAATAALT